MAAKKKAAPKKDHNPNLMVGDPAEPRDDHDVDAEPSTEEGGAETDAGLWPDAVGTEPESDPLINHMDTTSEPVHLKNLLYSPATDRVIEHQGNSYKLRQGFNAISSGYVADYLVGPGYSNSGYVSCLGVRRIRAVIGDHTDSQIEHGDRAWELFVWRNPREVPENPGQN